MAYVNDRSALSPFAQAFTETQNRSYATNPAQQQELFRQEQIRKVSGLAADQFEGLGAEGSAWAARLRQDPYAAAMLADSQGGFGAIHQRLRNSVAAGSAAGQEALADPLAREAWVSGGPQALQALQQGGYYQGRGRQANAVADVISQMLGGGAGPGGMGGGLGMGAPGEDPALGQALAFGLAGMPETGQLIMKIREAKNKPVNEAIPVFQSAAKPIIEDLRKNASDLQFLHTANFGENPAADSWLAKLAVQQVEPGLAVQPGESAETILAATSKGGALFQRALSMMNIDGTFTPQARRLIVEMVYNGLTSRTQSNLAFLQGLQAEASDSLGSLGGAPSALTRAIVGEQAPMEEASRWLAEPYDFDKIAPPFDPNQSDIPGMWERLLQRWTPDRQAPGSGVRAGPTAFSPGAPTQAPVPPKPMRQGNGSSLRGKRSR